MLRNPTRILNFNFVELRAYFCVCLCVEREFYEGYDSNLERNALVNKSSVQEDPFGKPFRKH